MKITGTDDDDVLAGTSGADTIRGLGGNDTIVSNGGAAADFTVKVLGAVQFVASDFVL